MSMSGCNSKLYLYLMELLIDYFYSIRILVTSDHSGLIETVKNSISIHSIKKEAYIKKWNEEGSVFTLKDYYVKVNLLKKKRRKVTKSRVEIWTRT